MADRHFLTLGRFLFNLYFWLVSTGYMALHTGTSSSHCYTGYNLDLQTRLMCTASASAWPRDTQKDISTVRSLKYEVPVLLW